MIIYGFKKKVLNHLIVNFLVFSVILVCSVGSSIRDTRKEKTFPFPLGHDRDGVSSVCLDLLTGGAVAKIQGRGKMIPCVLPRWASCDGPWKEWVFLRFSTGPFFSHVSAFSANRAQSMCP